MRRKKPKVPVNMRKVIRARNRLAAKKRDVIHSAIGTHHRSMSLGMKSTDRAIVARAAGAATLGRRTFVPDVLRRDEAEVGLSARWFFPTVPVAS